MYVFHTFFKMPVLHTFLDTYVKHALLNLYVYHALNIRLTWVFQNARFTHGAQCMNWSKASLIGWLVCFGLMSHSSIFQLYSDGTVVEFSNLDLLPGNQSHGHLGVFSVPSLPRHGHQTFLTPCHQRTHTHWGYAMSGMEHASSNQQSSPLPPTKKS